MSNTQQRTTERIEGEYEPEAVESKWQRRWIAEDTYAYGGADDADTSFTIDTPPPTVSGDLHMGHLYQFTLQDFVARFHRMRDGDVYFPLGYDDNGIASERLTERELSVRRQEYERDEFQALTREVCDTYEAEFTEDVQSLAVSVDWNNTYRTIESDVQRISQLSFVELYEQGREYRRNAPTIWCPACETAISQVETEDADRDAHYTDVRFPLVDGDGSGVTISTTRPELLPACVAMFVHPDDESNADLVGETARVPLFDHEVPVLADERVDRETGTGVVMCCTFGDRTDIEWYQAHDLPLRIAIDESGTMTDVADEYAGLSTREAREAIVDDLDAAGYVEGRREITHAVQVHERCETDVEYLVTDQWYVKLLDKTDEYLELGREMDWYPEKMFTRYRHWVEGLEWDWCISRQRDSGVPFPVWYCTDCGETILAERADLPVDPLSDDPPVDACPACGGGSFDPEEDVFDTWATSSLTPLVHAGWDYDAATDALAMDRPQLYPMDLRPQGHDIVSFWLFHTVVKCYEHTGEVPFDAVMLNGMVLDENREAMSKSKGNVVTPGEVLEEFSVDATRYWAAGTSIGDDFPFTENDLVTGKKLLQKLWNASKLVDSLADADPDEPAELDALDEWLLAELDDVTAEITRHMEAYEFSKARDRLRSFFWHTFCDDYLEIAKRRDAPSTDFALRTAHERFLRLFAPFLPHVTEELWHRLYGEASVHEQSWPRPAGYEADREAGETAMEVVGALRTYKAERGRPLNADVEHVAVYGPVDGFEDAIASVMHVREFDRLDDPPETGTRVVDVDLDYSTLGPEYGSRVEEFDAALDAGDFEIRDGALLVAGERLAGERFEAREERRYDGDGDLLQTENAVVLVR
ncbi:valine--tRNA ligase [Halomicrococcus sp. SG-WS-1]|uniref:valine--tRNA ligase n=1 Tax=Halomicrococcus sp. SG-WS-1 TaxID=3439057 RepID=UPI003F7AC3A3